MWSGLVAEHVLTRTVRDSAAMLDCVAGRAPGDPYGCPVTRGGFLTRCGRPPPRLRVAMTTRTFAGLAIADPCRDAALETAALLSDLGHDVEEATPNFDVAGYAEAHATILAANIATIIYATSRQLGRTPGPENLEPMTLWLFEEGRRRSAIDLVRAQEMLNSTSRAVAGFFERFDILLTPTLAMPPPPIGHLFGHHDGAELRQRTLAFVPFTHLFNGTGQPAISLPAKRDDEGLPIGIQLVARYGEDACLLQLASEIETARPWPTLPATLVPGNDASDSARHQTARERQKLQKPS
jgi:amidase